MEAKIKIILNTASSRHEAQKMLQKENFTADDILRIMQKYYRYFSLIILFLNCHKSLLIFQEKFQRKHTNDVHQ
jgi:hypothetical protein